MKKLVILGAGQMGHALRTLLNPNAVELVAFGDNMASGEDEGVPVLSVAEAAQLGPDLMIAAVSGEERCAQLEAQARWEGYRGELLRLSDLREYFDLRAAEFALIAGRLNARKVPGCVAELGVFQGDTARVLNALFPDRTLYLFDTFTGFTEVDLLAEHQATGAPIRPEEFADTSVEAVKSRLPFPERAVFCPGRFPETAEGLEERFALVSLDPDLYAPTLAGLNYFVPRLAPGGVIVLHDYGNGRFPGVKKAVAEYETQNGPFCLLPLCDMHRSAILMRPW